MPQKYDCVVIGAGLGGLSAATMLVRNGLGVLLLERHNVPGGYATSFVRGRYESEVALHELSGIGSPERPASLYRYLPTTWGHVLNRDVRDPRVRLLSGRVFQPAYTGLRESDRQHGYIHVCVSYPMEDLQIHL